MRRKDPSAEPKLYYVVSSPLSLSHNFGFFTSVLTEATMRSAFDSLEDPVVVYEEIFDAEEEAFESHYQTGYGNYYQPAVYTVQLSPDDVMKDATVPGYERLLAFKSKMQLVKAELTVTQWGSVYLPAPRVLADYTFTHNTHSLPLSPTAS